MIKNSKMIDVSSLKLQHCVWELTLACNLSCIHCGSGAGKKRNDELNTFEAFDVISQLSKLKCALVTLTGGEPLLRKDWFEIASSIKKSGMMVNMVTNGSNVDEKTAKKIKEAGLVNIAVSIDGPEKIHDTIRGAGTYDRAMRGIAYLKKQNIPTTVLTTVNTLNLDKLESIRKSLEDMCVDSWRFQLARPMGNMSRHRDLIIDPKKLLTLLPNICDLNNKSKISINIGDCIGYHSIYDAKLRGLHKKEDACYWDGCQAGRKVLGIESNGNIKGCLSIQPGHDQDSRFIEGNTRQHQLKDLWFSRMNFVYNRQISDENLRGICKKCPNGKRCRGGAKCMAISMTGKMRGSPYCYYQQSHEFKKKDALNLSKNLAASAASFFLIWSGAGAENVSAANNSNRVDSQSEILEDKTNLKEQPNIYLASPKGTCIVPEPPMGCELGVVYGVNLPPNINNLNGKIVTNKEGKTKGLEGVTVTLAHESLSIIAETTTDSSGNYSFNGFPASLYYNLRFEKNSYQTIEIENIYICNYTMPETNLPDCKMSYHFPWSLFLPAIEINKQTR